MRLAGRRWNWNRFAFFSCGGSVCVVRRRCMHVAHSQHAVGAEGGVGKRRARTDFSECLKKEPSSGLQLWSALGRPSKPSRRKPSEDELVMESTMLFRAAANCDLPCAVPRRARVSVGRGPPPASRCPACRRRVRGGAAAVGARLPVGVGRQETDLDVE
jgi:hypothetical protein